MFQVIWLESALNELATIWIGSDSTLRPAITAATHAIDHQLTIAPHDQGESRASNLRIMFQMPLALTYEIQQERGVVRILHVWLVQRRSIE